MAGIREQVVQDPGADKVDVRRLHTFTREAVLFDEVRTAYVAVTSAYVATEDDHVIFVDVSSGTVTVTLPNAVDVPGREYVVKKTDTSAFEVSMETSGGNIEDSIPPYNFGTTARDARTFRSDGTEWWII